MASFEDQTRTLEAFFCSYEPLMLHCSFSFETDALFSIDMLTLFWRQNHTIWMCTKHYEENMNDIKLTRAHTRSRTEGNLPEF